MHRGCPPPVPIHGIAFSLILVRTRIKVASGKWRRVNVPRDDDDDEEPLPFLSLLFKRCSSQRDRTKNALLSKFIHAHVFSPAFLESLKRDARLLFSRILRFFSSSSRVKISLEIRWKPITYRLGGGSGWLADDKSRREGFVNATRV